MKKQTKLVMAFTLTAGLVFNGLPYQVFAANTVNKLELKNVNALTKATAETAHAAEISPNLNTKSKKPVRVIVQFQSQPMVVAKALAKGKRQVFSASSVEARVKNEQRSFQEAASKRNIDLQVHRTFRYVLNGMEVTVPANQIPELAKLPGVKSIYENAHYYALPIAGDENLAETAASGARYDLNPLNQIHVPEMWAAGYTGKGIKVGVIDTGVDYLHPDLKDAYKGGYDSFDDDKDPYEQAPIPIDKDPRGTGYEGSEHGTHVSGTIVGRDANPTSKISVKGIAYEADLYVYRVLGRDGGSSAQVIDGIERAVKDGMDVINLSLGSDAEKNPNSPDSIALNNAVLAGVTVCVANGNAAQNAPGQYYYTLGSPAVAQLVTSVGATTTPTPEISATADATAGTDTTRYDLKVMAWEATKDDLKAVLGTKPIPAVYCNLGTVEDFANVDAKGKVALISRGTNAFVDKIKNAKNAGAVAAVIFNGNDRDGDGQADLDLPAGYREGNIDVFIGESFNNIPTFDMKGIEGRKLAKAIVSDPEKARSFTFSFGDNYTKTTKPGGLMAGFSSRGPNMDGDYGIKPDVVAPGTYILSSVPAYGKMDPNADYNKAYTRLDGTSMATPHIAGLSALLKQAHPDWTPFDIRAALANTAEPITDEEGTRYDVYSQGAGQVNGEAALKTPALLESVEEITILDKDFAPKQVTNYGDNVSFGLLAPGSEKTKKLQLKNTSNKSVSYQAEIHLHPSVTTDPWDPKDTPDASNLKVTLGKLNDDRITADGNQTVLFDLTVQPDEDAAAGVYEGEVLLKSEDDHPDLHLPFVVHVGTEREDTHFGFDQFEVSSSILSPNGDGEDDTIDASALLTATDVNHIYLDVYGLDDLYIGTLAEMVTLNDAGEPTYEPIAPGNITFANIDGSYLDGTLDSRGRPVVKHLTDGEYKLVIVGVNQDVTKPLSEQILATYLAFSAFKVVDSNVTIDKEQLKREVAKAKAEFEPLDVNTTVIGEKVLSLPTHVHNLTYTITATSNKTYISPDGTLLALPAKGSKKVYVWVTIASKLDPSIKATVKWTVTLEPPKQTEETTP